MGHDHRHDHSHGKGAKGADLRRLSIVLGLVLLYMAAEVVGGLLTRSLALLADAGHMLSDAGALGLSLFALRIARRPSTAQRTFGYHRAEILAALVNGVTLVVIAVFITREAWERFRSPEEVLGAPMMAIAVGGLVVNLVGMWVLHGGAGGSLNVRGAWLHVAADALGSVQAIAAGALIWAFGWNWVDPLASVLIALLVVGSSWTLLRDSVDILMESTPKHLDGAEVKAAMAGVEGVEGVHDLHLWTITSGFESLSAHLEVGDHDRDQVLTEVSDLLRDRFDIEHTTLQLEPADRCTGGGCEGEASKPG